MSEREPETLYTTTYQPDVSRALDVLAFLLVPESSFISPKDCPGTRAAVFQTLGAAKREALLRWYAIHIGLPK